MKRRGFLSILGRAAVAAPLAPLAKLVAPAIAPPEIYTLSRWPIDDEPLDLESFNEVMKSIYSAGGGVGALVYARNPFADLVQSMRHANLQPIDRGVPDEERQRSADEGEVHPGGSSRASADAEGGPPPHQA